MRTVRIVIDEFLMKLGAKRFRALSRAKLERSRAQQLEYVASVRAALRGEVSNG